MLHAFPRKLPHLHIYDTHLQCARSTRCCVILCFRYLCRLWWELKKPSHLIFSIFFLPFPCSLFRRQNAGTNHTDHVLYLATTVIPISDLQVQMIRGLISRRWSIDWEMGREEGVRENANIHFRYFRSRDVHVLPFSRVGDHSLQVKRTAMAGCWTALQ